MLMMSRRIGEVILIGDDIEIVIARIGRSRVTVGICAPRHMPVEAREVKLVEEENRTAASNCSAADLSSLIAQLKPASSSSDSRRREKQLARRH
jgi:carbon storage regulator